MRYWIVGVVMGIVLAPFHGWAQSAAACFPTCRAGFHCDGGSCVADLPAPAAPTAPAPAATAAAATGKLRVVAFERATVNVNGASVGTTTPAAPLVVMLPVGTVVELEVEYEGGGSDDRDVLVLPDQEQRIEFMHEPSYRHARKLRVHHLYFGAGGAFGVGPEGHDFEEAELRPELYGVIGYGLAGGVDLQLLPTIAVPIRPEGGVAFQVSLEPRLLFHLGSVYTMALGGNFMIGSGGTDTGRGYDDSGCGTSCSQNESTSRKVLHASPSRGVEVRASPFGLQFGHDRQSHLEMYGWFGAEVYTDTETYKYISNGKQTTRVDSEASLGPRVGGGLRYTYLFKFL